MQRPQLAVRVTQRALDTLDAICASTHRTRAGVLQILLSTLTHRRLSFLANQARKEDTDGPTDRRTDS